jgi:exodeoxyribonuclease VII large subunit
LTEFNASPSPNKVLTVTELNRLARNILEQSFPLFWVSGEISNFTRAASGHWYFSLKDSGAQVRCVMFKGRNSYVDFIPREGDKIEARCTVTLYEARGDFQLTVEFVQRAGLGALFEAFEKLKNKLAIEGLFDEANKKIIPLHPKQIGIVTSPDAAALRDVLTTLKRRMPNIPVIIYPTPVQGRGAAELIANAINTANTRAECDLLIICRGGGSIEDLWQFNEEIVARAIAQCSIPTISGVGHETDFTICDFVADVRAATPTAAAELAAPSIDALRSSLKQLKLQLIKNMQFSLNQHAQSLDYLARRLISPVQQIERQKIQLTQIAYRLSSLMKQQFSTKQQSLLRLGQNLQHLNPQAVLIRGYAFVQDSKGSIINSSTQLKTGDEVKLTLSIGSADAIISKTNA